MSDHHSKEFKATICSFKGKLTAKEVGERFGLSKGAVIGIWWRAGTLPIRNGKSVVSQKAKLERLHRHYAQHGRPEPMNGR